MINRNQVNADYTEERSWIFLKSSDIWKFSKHLYNTWLDKTLCLKKCCLKNGVFGKCISVCERGRIHIKQVLKICKAIYHQIHCHLYHLSPFSTLESKENGHKVARRNEKAKIRQVTNEWVFGGPHAPYSTSSLVIWKLSPTPDTLTDPSPICISIPLLSWVIQL